MAFQVKPLHPLFAAEIGGLDLRAALDAATVAALWREIERHAVLVFPDQQLDNAAQVAFARLFGEIEPPSQKTRHKEARHRIAEPEISDISNLDADDQVVARDSRRRMDGLGNRLWHTDASFKRVPGALSMLYAHQCPSSGGDTEFADLRAAWDALPAGRRAECEGLVAEHSIWHSRAQIGFTDFTEADRATTPPVPQRLVRTLPHGRRTLYLAEHAARIEGWPVPEGRIFLRELIEFATRREFVYSHAWKPGQLVVWDNRCTMHRATPFDAAERRDMRRVTTRDVASTLEQAA